MKPQLLFALFFLSLLACNRPATAVGPQTTYDPLAEEEMLNDKSQEEPVLREGALLGIHFLKPREGVSATERKNFLKDEYFPAWRNLVPGSRVHYIEGERGTQDGKDVYLWVFRDQATRDLYWSEKDVSTERYDKLRSTVDHLYTDSTFHRYNAGWEDELSADYIVLESGKPVEKDWLQPGAVIGFHHIALKPGVNKELFEKFITDMWAPTRSDALPGSKVFFLKGVRGDREGEYAYIWMIESEDMRDYYFPAEAEASDMFQEFSKVWQWVEDEDNLGKFTGENAEDDFTDFVVIQ